jgi:hypothetical protein
MIQVKATTSFFGLGQLVQKGQILDLPPGADWLQAGLVEPVTPISAADQPETPEDHLPPVERAVAGRKRKAQ